MSWRDGWCGGLHNVVNDVLWRGWYLRRLRQTKTFGERRGILVNVFWLDFIGLRLISFLVEGVV